MIHSCLEDWILEKLLEVRLVCTPLVLGEWRHGPQGCWIDHGKPIAVSDVHLTAAPKALEFSLSYIVFHQPSPCQEPGVAAVWGKGGFCFLYPKPEMRVWVAIIISAITVWRRKELCILVFLILAKHNNGDRRNSNTSTHIPTLLWSIRTCFIEDKNC